MHRCRRSFGQAVPEGNATVRRAGAAPIVAAMLLVLTSATTVPAHADDALVAACKATDPDTSIAACTQILDGNPAPDLAELAWRTRGFRLEAKSDYAKAIVDFTEALRIKPAYYGTLTARGTSYVRLNDFDRAAADFDAALQLKQDFAAAFSGRSLMDYFAGHMDQTIADATQAIRLDPKQVAAYNNRGNALREKGDFDGALIDLNVAIRLSPYASRPLYNRGLIYFRKGDLQHALDDYNAAVTLNPKETDAAAGRDAVTAILAARGPATSKPPATPPAPPVAVAAPARAPVPANASKTILTVTSEGGSLGPDDGPAEADPVASRKPDAGTVWVPFTARRLGLQFLVQQANNPADRFVFSENETWVEVSPVVHEAGTQPMRVIRVLTKPPGQPVEEAIANEFIAALPPVARQWCKVMRAEVPSDPGPGKFAFEIRPTGAYGRKWDALMKAGDDVAPALMGCGTYGAGAATAFFEYNPDEDKSRYLFVFAGFEQPFDEGSIRLVTPTDPAPAPSASPPPTGQADDRRARMQGTFAAPHRTASVSPSGLAGRFAASLRVDATGGCSGEAEGTGAAVSPYKLSVAVPDPSGGPVCTIDMIYDKSYASVQIAESDGCLTWHGAQCNFVGKLQRR